MYRITSLLAALFLGVLAQGLAFCGFYVAKADASLFNNKSEVIIARHDGQTVITMSSDFTGDIKDFAMVVPVPAVLKRSQIRLVEQALFSRLDAYSGPRLVEYYDPNPCPLPAPAYSQKEMLEVEEESVQENVPTHIDELDDLGVSIEDSYSVGEYDILILSAKESDGLQQWLEINGYKLPRKAAEVLEPYVKSELKFFVVKVNLDRNPGVQAQQLKPIQMTFRSNKFGLPIRLGMANAREAQDMIVYAFSTEGRIETTNYPTRELGSNKDIPLFVQNKFDNFYTSLFAHAWEQQKNSVWVEYAWNLDGSNFVKCDPCPTQPPAYRDLREAGVFWLKGPGNGFAYQGKVFMTRLHVRYDRENFPQDLQFNLTPNRKNFQLRYVTRHPAGGDLGCSAAQAYLKKLRKRREKEVANLASLTGWNTKMKSYHAYIHAYDHLIEENGFFGPLPKDEEDRGIGGFISFPFVAGTGLALLIFSLVMYVAIRRWRHPRAFAT